MDKFVWIAVPIILVAFWWFVIHTDDDGNVDEYYEGDDSVPNEDGPIRDRERFDRADRR